MNANLHHLELFYYVAKAKGISNALGLIPYGIQQPAISQQMIRLEESLGVRLFERKPFQLTPAGETLFRYLSRFFGDLDNELASLKDYDRIRIRFGCPSIISSKYLPELIRRLLTQFPKLQPSVLEQDGNRGIPELQDRQIDVLITFSAPHKSKAMSVSTVAKFPMCLIVPDGHPFCKGFWPKSDFASTNWIALQESSGGTQELCHGLSAFGISPVFSLSTNSIEACLDYVSMGLGIALMAMPPLDLLKGKHLTALPCDDIFGSVPLSIVWMNDTLLDENILDHVVTCAKGMIPSIMQTRPATSRGKRNGREETV